MFFGLRENNVSELLKYMRHYSPQNQEANLVFIHNFI